MDGFLWRHSWEHIPVPAWAGGSADCRDHCTCRSARQDFSGRFAYKQQAELKKPFGRRCQSSDRQQVFGSCCQALLTASEVQRLRLVSFIQGTEHTRLMSILPSSASLLGWFVVFLGLTLQFIGAKSSQPQKNPASSRLIYITQPVLEHPGGKSGSKARKGPREVVP